MAATRALLAAMLIFLFCLLARQPVAPAFRRSPQLALGMLGFGTLRAMAALGERKVDPELAMLLVCIVPIATRFSGRHRSASASVGRPTRLCPQRCYGGIRWGERK
jgi:hypothetical protein